jgi:hypothetical protein
MDLDPPGYPRPGDHRPRGAGGASAASRLTGNTATIRLAVQPQSAQSAAGVLDSFGARYQTQRSPGRVAYLIANPDELTADEHPFAGELPAALERAGVATIAFRAP